MFRPQLSVMKQKNGDWEKKDWAVGSKDDKDKLALSLKSR
jgi:hypothetical protein